MWRSLCFADGVAGEENIVVVVVIVDAFVNHPSRILVQQ
jgi:hypothetical protein